MKKKNKEYVITKDGKDCFEFSFDVIETYSLARETLKEIRENFPNSKWGIREWDGVGVAKDSNHN